MPFISLTGVGVEGPEKASEDSCSNMAPASCDLGQVPAPLGSVPFYLGNRNSYS